MNGVSFYGIGTGTGISTSFTGVFDGNGYSIKNLSINSGTVSNVGLFCYTRVALIKNLSVVNADIIGNGNVGIIIGRGRETIVRDCNVSGTVTGNSSVGSIVGY